MGEPNDLPPEDDIYIQEEEPTDQQGHQNDNYYFTQTSSTPAPSCTEERRYGEDWNSAEDNAKFLVLLSTLDGNMVALDVAEGGREAWSLMTDSQPLLSSTLKNSELYSTMDYRLIPSLDGSLYYYRSGILQAMPMNADALLSGTMQVGYDAVSGGKHLLTYGVNAYSGKVHYSCSMNGCQNSAKNQFYRDNLVIRRRTQTVRAVDTTTGKERWNVTMGEHELLFTEETLRAFDQQWAAHSQNGASACRGDRSAYDSEFWKQFDSVEIIIDPPSGVVRAIDTAALGEETVEPLWSVKLKSPIAQAWQIKRGELEVLSLFDPRVVPSLEFMDYHYPVGHDDDTNAVAVQQRSQIEDSLLYFGTFDKDLYVIPSPQERHKLQRMALTATAAGLRNAEERLQLSSEQELNKRGTSYRGYRHDSEAPSNALARKDDFDRPSFVASYQKPSKYALDGMPRYEDGCPTETKYHKSQCFSHCETCSNDEIRSMLLREHQPFQDQGWYFFKHQSAVTGHMGDETFRAKMKKKGTRIKDKLVSSGLIEVLWAWWKACLLVFLSSVCTVFTLRHYGLVHIGGRDVVEQKEEEKVTKQLSVKTTSDASGQTTSTTVSDATGGTTPSVEGPGKVRKTECGSQASLEEITDHTLVEEDFSSRFLNDFEALRCLGKGGFGVVFKSRNMMDDVEYAVKRIAVTNSESAREKVVREVKMLAKLDHPGIVRYFNSWIECPPCNWQDKTDKKLLEKCGGVKKLSIASGFDPTSLASTSTSDWPPTNLDQSAKGIVTSSSKNKWEWLDRTASKTSDGFSKIGDVTRTKANGNDESLAEELDKKLFQFGLESIGSNSKWAEPSSSSSSEASENNEESEHQGDTSLEIKFQRTKSVDKELQAGPPGVASCLPISSAKPTKMYLYIQMQLCQEWTLRDFLESHNGSSAEFGPPDRGLVLDWFAQILIAVEYVHDCGLIHRDLKPSNIFFAQNGQIKVGDFGLATAILDEDEDDEIRFADTDNSPENRGQSDSGFDTNGHGHRTRPTRLTGQVGTQLYMSPEQLAGQTYNSKVDVFSMGLIFMELLQPFGTQMERIRTLQDLRKGCLSKGFKEENPIEAEFVLWLVTTDPENRPTCTEVRESDFFQEEIVEKGHYSAIMTPLRGVSKVKERSRTASSRSNSSGKAAGIGAERSSESCSEHSKEGNNNLSPKLEHADKSEAPFWEL